MDAPAGSTLLAAMQASPIQHLRACELDDMQSDSRNRDIAADAEVMAPQGNVPMQHW